MRAGIERDGTFHNGIQGFLPFSNNLTDDGKRWCQRDREDRAVTKHKLSTIVDENLLERRESFTLISPKNPDSNTLLSLKHLESKHAGKNPIQMVNLPSQLTTRCMEEESDP
nr:hypothetical protein L204_00340 [Cryptococcus depauperatus CBS 7855]